MNVSVKFVLADSSVVNFYYDEIDKLAIESLFRTEIIEPLYRKTFLDQQGTEVKKISVSFLGDIRTTTRVRIKQLLDSQDELTMYYHYNISQSDSIGCIPVGKLERYFGDAMEMQSNFEMAFIQSS
jgi:hypothetical protein